MAKYTPEFLTLLKHRYENTDVPMRTLSREFKIGISTLSSLVEREGWSKRSQRPRGRASRDLMIEAEQLVASLPSRGGPAVIAPEVPMFPAIAGEAGPTPAPLSPAARLEALIVKEIDAEEAIRADLDTLPRMRGEAERCARTLAVLTQTLQTLRKLKAEEPPPDGVCPHCGDDDLPADVDAMRMEFARRIRLFCESRQAAAESGSGTGTDTPA